MKKRITIYSLPRSSRNQIIDQPDESLKVKLTAAPVDGEANKKLIELLSKHFGVKKHAVTIVRGKTAKTKVIEIKQ